MPFNGRLHFSDTGAEEHRQQRDVVRTLAQWRHNDRDHIEAIVEILAELACLDGILDILVGGRKHPGFHLQGTSAPYRSNSCSCSARNSFGL